MGITSLPIQATRSEQPRIFAQKVNRFLENHSTDCVFSLERGIRADIYRAGDGVHRSWIAQRARFHPIRGRLSQWFNVKHRVISELECFTFCAENTQQIIANSDMVKKNILHDFDYPEENIAVIPNGVDFEYFSSGDRAKGRAALGIQENEFVLLLVGKGVERKGHAYARKVAEHARARLIIIDRPPNCPMPCVYSAADVFLFPTLYDPFANVTLEAMAAGLPVITTADNGAKMLIQNTINGFVVTHAACVDTMSQYVEALKSDVALRKKIGLAARATAHTCSMESHVEKTLQLCDKCVHAKE